MNKAMQFDLVAHLKRQREFSYRTFGGGSREDAILDHIAKELIELRGAGSCKEELGELVDVLLLAMDAAWRIGYEPEEIAEAIAAKQAINEARTWPDWRTAPKHKAIEHIRGESSKGGAA